MVKQVQEVVELCIMPIHFTLQLSSYQFIIATVLQVSSNTPNK